MILESLSAKSFYCPIHENFPPRNQPAIRYPYKSGISSFKDKYIHKYSRNL